VPGGCSDGRSPGSGDSGDLALSGASLIWTRPDGSRQTLVTLKSPCEWRFFGFAGSEALFLACDNPEGGEASTFFYLYDLKSGEKHLLCEEGGTGEAAFAVNHDGSLVAFAWFDGIYIIQLAGVLEQVRRGEPLAGCKDFEARLLKVVEEYSAFCHLAWVGPSRLEYGFWHGEGRDWPDWECTESVLELSEEQMADLDRLALK
jgi:hypothetical protein